VSLRDRVKTLEKFIMFVYVIQFFSVLRVDLKVPQAVCLTYSYDITSIAVSLDPFKGRKSHSTSALYESPLS